MEPFAVLIVCHGTVIVYHYMCHIVCRMEIVVFRRRNKMSSGLFRHVGVVPASELSGKAQLG
jgi:hypothetical protein